MLLNTLSKSLF